MKNKIVIISTILIMTLTVCTTVFAAANAEIVVTSSETKITPDTKEIVLNVKLGTLTEVQEGKPMGYVGTFEYDTNIFESINIIGMNGWSATIANGKIQGDTSQVAANQEIAKITLKLKSDLSSIIDTTTAITLKDVHITDDVNLDITVNKTISIQMDTVHNKNNEENNTVTNETNSTITNTNTKTLQDNTTIKESKLPATGIKMIVIPILLVLIVLAIVLKIKSRKIKY